MIANLEELKTQIDIFRIVSHYIALRKEGANYTACCPFHDEKTPSFVVNTQKNLFYCFGCAKGGDAIAFVTEHKNCSFNEAIIEIADILNFTLVYEESKYAKTQSALYEVNMEFLDHSLNNQSSILEFCTKRGITKEVIKEFRLGYGGENYEIRKALQNDTKSAQDVGILFETNNGFKSMFARRLIIPIFSENAKCIAFSSRAIYEDDTNAKYINSKESRIYKKKHILFGFHIAKNYLQANKEMYIVEGYFDVLALHTLGYKNSVGICSASLSKEHIALLSRYKIIPILSLDNDMAGYEATKRAIKLFLANEIYKAYVLELNTQCKDFNDILLQDTQSLKSAKKTPIIEYMIHDLYNRLHGSNLVIEEKQKIVQECHSFLSCINDNYIRQEYYKYANALFGFEIGVYKKIQAKTKKQIHINASPVLMRILKQAFNNKKYKHILVTFTSKEDYKDLELLYEDCLQDNLSSNLANLLFHTDHIKPYKNDEEFLTDINALLFMRKKTQRANIIRSDMSLREKIKAIKNQ